MLRPVRPVDRERVLEIVRDVWDGMDYMPDVLDAWLADPGASFQAAEVDGVVVAVQRLRPIAPGIVFYEGLRVASTHRRRGIARAILRRALDEGRGLGFREIRLYTGNPDAGRLFASEGFRLVAESSVWSASRLEGDDLPRLASPGEAASLARWLGGDPGWAAYGGVNPDWHATLDVDADLLERLATLGRVRLGPGARALALVRELPRSRLPVTFLAGSGAALQDLLTGLRYEADSQGLRGVALLAPPTHPAAGDLREVGYDLAGDEGRAYVYAREL